MKHEIIKTDDGFSCTVCQWRWGSKPRSACPGVVRYLWLAAPENLMTAYQLKKKKLNPGPQRGIVGDWYLYDIAEATPWTAEQIAKHKQDRLRKCLSCGRMVDCGRFSERYQACKKCLPAAIEKHERETQERKESLEREFQERLVRDRDHAILWARKLLTQSNWVVLDTETTGLEAYVDEVIQIAVVGSQGEILLDQLIKPLQAIPEHVTHIHGITNEIVANAPSFPEVFPQICEVLKDRTVIVYNEDFDYTMILGTCARNDLKNFTEALPDQRQSWRCAMYKYAAFVGQWHDYYQDYRWQPLPRSEHHAAGDCMAVIELIKEMAAAKLSTEADLVSAAAAPADQESREFSQEEKRNG